MYGYLPRTKEIIYSGNKLPQYLVITMAKVIFVVTINKFEFTEVYIFSLNDIVSFSSFKSLGNLL